MKTKTIKGFKQVFFGFLSLLLFAIPHALASDFYQDANGLFSFVPPRGWKQKLYTDSRSKIEYFDPSKPENKIRIIAMAEQESSIAEFKTRKDRIKKIFPSATITTEEVTVSGIKGVKHCIDSPSLELILFYKDGHEYSISLEARDRETIKNLKPIYDACLQTLTIGKRIGISESEIIKNRCSQWVRLIDLFHSLKMPDYAEYYRQQASEAKCGK